MFFFSRSSSFFSFFPIFMRFFFLSASECVFYCIEKLRIIYDWCVLVSRNCHIFPQYFFFFLSLAFNFNCISSRTQLMLIAEVLRMKVKILRFIFQRIRPPMILIAFFFSLFGEVSIFDKKKKSLVIRHTISFVSALWTFAPWLWSERGEKQFCVGLCFIYKMRHCNWIELDCLIQMAFRLLFVPHFILFFFSFFVCAPSEWYG